MKYLERIQDLAPIRFLSSYLYNVKYHSVWAAWARNGSDFCNFASIF